MYHERRTDTGSQRTEATPHSCARPGSPIKQIVDGLIGNPGFAAKLVSQYGNNAGFTESFFELLVNSHTAFSEGQTESKTMGFYLTHNAAIRQALLMNNTTLIPDMIQSYRPTLENCVTPSFDYNMLLPLIAESNDSIKTLFIYHLVDTSSQSQMLTMLSHFGLSYSTVTASTFASEMKTKLSRMSSRDQESAFTSVYTSAAFSGVYDSTVKRILNDSLYVYKSYSGISFGKLEMHLKEKVVENGDNAVLETYYDGLPTDILYTSSTLQERVAVVYEDETLPLMDAFILEGDAGGTLAAALEKVAGMSPGMFAMGWANISPADAVDINLIMLPVMEKEKFFLAEHHLYGSSRLGIKKYWPNQYLFEWDKSQTTSWNGTQFENVELASHRPWYSQAHNQMISTYATVPWGNAHNDKMSSERVLGLKQYELTNHLGNVMSVILDKVTESPKANATTFPAEVDKRASLSAAYDYYPFGMLMPGRYAEDESVQCTHITKTRYESQMLQVVDLPLAQTADLAVFSPNQLTQLSIVNSTTGSYMKAEKSSTANGNTEFFTIFNAQSINQEVKIVTNISNLGTNALTVSLYQQDGNADWQLLDNQTLASTSELNLTGTTTSMNPLKVVWSSYNGTFKVSGVKYIVKDLYAVSYQEEICNTDDDFKDDYRFGFNGQQKDNEIAGTGNHNTALFWEYDTRLGRRWNLDPVDQIGISNYATFANNPIFNTDALGNVKKGINSESAANAKTLMDESIQKDRGSEKMRKLFKVGSDGLTFNKIDNAAYKEAYDELQTDEAKLMANGFKEMINQDEIVYIAALRGGEKIDVDPQVLKETKKSSNLISDLNGSTLNKSGKKGGSAVFKSDISLVTTTMDGHTTYDGGAVFSTDGIRVAGYSPSRSGTYVHEGVGHYLSRKDSYLKGVSKDEALRRSNESAIQMYNVHLRLNKPGYYDNGQSHNRIFGIPTSMPRSTYSGTPSYLTTPFYLRR